MIEMLLLTATVLSGLLAGVFVTFTLLVMPGLARVEDTTFVDAMRSINASIHPLFAVVFFGTPLMVIASTVAAWRDDAAPGWTTAALVLVVLTFAATFLGNVPRNYALARGTDDRATRADFETAWVKWNLARTLTSTAALACLARALHLTG